MAKTLIKTDSNVEVQAHLQRKKHSIICTSKKRMFCVLPSFFFCKFSAVFSEPLPPFDAVPT